MNIPWYGLVQITHLGTVARIREMKNDFKKVTCKSDEVKKILFEKKRLSKIA